MEANFKSSNKKVVLIGTGMVGMSYAYSMLNSGGVCDELVLIDINKERAQGEAMDLNHGLAFSNYNMNIYAGEYSDCSDADIVTICAGIPRGPGDSRLDLLNKNVEIFKSIINPVMESGFNGCFLIATNPVDVMAYVTQKLSGLDCSRVIGSGTALDTARLRYLLGRHFNFNPKNIHAYVMGEHGDSSFVPWSQANIGTMKISELCNEAMYSSIDLDEVADEVKKVAASVIKAKRATYYSIGIVLKRITKAILSDEHSIITLSAMLNGEYGKRDVSIGVPCIVGNGGILKVVQLKLTEEENKLLDNSCEIIGNLSHGLGL